MNQDIISLLVECEVSTDKKMSKKLNIPLDELRKKLIQLEQDKIIYNNKGYYSILKKGKIQLKDKGFGFISVEGEEEDYFVSENDTFGAFNNDIVLFYIDYLRMDGKLKKASIVSIVERGFKEVIGKLVYKEKKGKGQYQVISHNPDFNVKAIIKKEDLNSAVDGSIVVAKIEKYVSLDKVFAKITKVIGHCDDPGIDISEIAANYGFEAFFSQEVMDEANNTPNEPDAASMQDRRDFTKEIIITIDGDDSKDFDDAVNVKILENGNYFLGVYIADVCHYVTQNSELDAEALKRGTSVYLADRVIPMLPHKLSNGICSLNEGVNRLTMCCLMEIDNKGNLVNYEICEGVICSTHRMTYQKVNRILNENDSDLIHEYQDIHEMLLNMRKLSSIIRERREKKGGLEFDVAEYKIILNEKGKPVDIKLRTRDVAEMMIEDFMLQANETVAYHMNIMQLPCVYRVHEDPDQEKITNVLLMIKNLGNKVNLSKKKIYPKTIQTVMKDLKDSPTFLIVNQMLLRSMMKAKYSEQNLGHYGLAMQYYCHFTSPIRRYPDLMVHRLIKKCLLHPTHLEEDIIFYNNILPEIAKQNSICEKKAIECEREVNDMLMAEYMVKYVNYRFTGIITSIVSFGMFVTLQNGVEGLVHISDMNGFFRFDDKKMSLISKNAEYQMGDKVDVVCVSSSKKNRKIDFMLYQDCLDFLGECIRESNSD